MSVIQTPYNPKPTLSKRRKARQGENRTEKEIHEILWKTIVTSSGYPAYGEEKVSTEIANTYVGCTLQKCLWVHVGYYKSSAFEESDMGATTILESPSNIGFMNFICCVFWIMIRVLYIRDLVV